MSLPAYPQPNAPQVSNFDAAQSINPSQPFTLTWDAFIGGALTCPKIGLGLYKLLHLRQDWLGQVWY